MHAALLVLLWLQTETAATEHFEVVSTHRDRDYVRQVADSLEAGYRAMAGLLGPAPAEPRRYRINLYAKPEEYRAKDQELNEGRFAANMAFSHPQSGEAYLQLQPRGGVPLMDRTRALFRHEAFHLMSYRHAPWLQEAPDWLQEGVSERAAELAERTRDSDPVIASVKFADAVTLVRSMIEQKRAVPLADLLKDGGNSHKDYLVRWTWYAEAWLLVKYLMERRGEAWTKFVRRLTEDPPAKRKSKEVLFDVTGETSDALEQAWWAWIATLRPAPWRRIEGDWTLTKDGVEGAAFPELSAYLLSDTTLRRRRYKIRAEAQISPVGTGQADLVLAPAGEDHGVSNLVKAIVSRTGVAAILIRSKGEWKQAASKDVDGRTLAPDRWIRLELEIDGSTIKFRVGGGLLVEHEVKEAGVELEHVRWGVGNYDSWTKFRSIEAK